MTVVAEIPAFKFKFDAHALPPFRTDLALGLAVGKPSLDSLDQVAKLLGNHSKQEYHALLVDRLVAQSAKIYGVAIGGTIL